MTNAPENFESYILPDGEVKYEQRNLVRTLTVIISSRITLLFATLTLASLFHLQARLYARPKATQCWFIQARERGSHTGQLTEDAAAGRRASNICWVQATTSTATSHHSAGADGYRVFSPTSAIKMH
jgi:hypothetical protein